MAFDKKLLDIIACPTCKGQLQLVTFEGRDEPELVCRFDRLAYAIKDNIPVLLEDQAREISLAEYESLK
ncbi:MAG: Trm112 family protein [Glaciecola sp.]